MIFRGVLCDSCKTPIEGAQADHLPSISRWWERVVVVTNALPRGEDVHAAADVCVDCAPRWFAKILQAAHDAQAKVPK